MTKRRAPLSFQQAITTIAGLIGYEAMGEEVGKTARAVRYWSEPDTGTLPTIEEARRLDSLYLEAGGEEPPLFTVYAHFLGEFKSSRAALAQAAATAAKESGECVAALILAAAPDATDAQKTAADLEAQEAVIAIETARQRLKPGAASAIVSKERM